MEKIDFWDEHWNSRMPGKGSVQCNTGKARRIIRWISSYTALASKRKFDIGCGTGFHIKLLSEIDPEWKNNYKGIDLSPVAVSKAIEMGINAEVGDIVTYAPSKGELYDVFFLLDSLEHIEDLNGASKKIKMLASSDARLFGNVPLYFTDHNESGGFERLIDINVVGNFLRDAGFDEFGNTIYGIHGYPYMIFEGKKGGVEKQRV